MPIKSYVAFPCRGKEEEFETTLRKMSDVDLIPSDNESVYIVITDTNSDKEDEAIQSELENISSIQCITLVSAFDDGIEISEEDLKRVTNKAAAQKLAAAQNN